MLSLDRLLVILYNTCGDKMSEVEKIKNVIDKLRAFLISDGGNLEFIKYEDNIVYVQLMGACDGCPLIDVTLKDGIEEMICSEIPEVKEVKLYESENDDNS